MRSSRTATRKARCRCRLRIAAGSLHENDNERGVAHFLEHMAFNGSTNYPEGEMFKALQRMGLAIGANANAATEFDNTTFSLSLPSVRPDILNTGLERTARDRRALDACRRRRSGASAA